MNGKSFLSLLFALCLVVVFSGLCTGEEPKALMVKKIAFARDKDGKERISLTCNQACAPELSSMEGEKPRVIMDIKEVSLIQTKTRKINTHGKWVKQVRSYWDKRTKILRIVLDLESSKHFIVHPMQDPSGNTYMLTIYESASSAGKVAKGNKNAGGSLPSQEMSITIVRSDPGTAQEGQLREAAIHSEKPVTVKATQDVPSMYQGRSQMNAGEFSAAVDTFTRILATHPEDSLSYRLRGNAYDNLAERKNAEEDWTRAARLGDTTMQSYLDFLQVKWR